MDRTALKTAFLSRIDTPIDVHQVGDLGERLKQANRKATAEDRIELAAALAKAAFLAPEHLAQVYDRFAESWLDQSISAKAISAIDCEYGEAPDGLWDAFWSVVEDAADGKLDALAITERTADLGGMMPEGFVLRVASSAHTYPGISEAAKADMPGEIELDTLALQPSGSIGAEFHQLIVENKFDLEVLDRNQIGLSALPSPLDFLNTRILQSHDLWHITAGYETTALHEIALSAFQMAQFGHNYSAQFLAVVAAVGALSPASGYKVLMDTVTTSWVHGRETYPMMLIPWEDVWHQSADEIRAHYEIKPYDRPYRADLIERTEPIVNLIRKIKALLAPFQFGRRSAA